MKIISVFRFINNIFINVIEVVLFVILVIAFVSINIGILGRIFNFSSPWVEDLCKFSLPWLAILGFVHAVEKRDTIAITIVLNSLGKVKYVVDIIIYLLTGLVGIMLTIYTHNNLIPILGDEILSSIRFLNMEVFYASLSIGGLFLLLVSCKQLFLVLYTICKQKSEV